MSKLKLHTRYFKPADLIIYITLLAIFLLGAFISAHGNKGDVKIAIITLDGQEVHRVDLSSVDTPYEFVIEASSEGYNLIRVEKGRIRVVRASCPDQIDVKQGWISKTHQSIICLPHRLLIRILPTPGQVEEIDGIAF